jgi:hypothetical protein
MNNYANLLQLLQMNNVFKIGFLTVNFIFIIFLVIVLKQIQAMNTIVSNANDSAIIKLAATLLLIIAVSLFLTALVIL